MFVEKKKVGFKYVICFGDYYIEKPISSILKKQWLRFVDTFAVDIFMETLIMQSPEIYEVRKIGKSVLKIACQNQQSESLIRLLNISRNMLCCIFNLLLPKVPFWPPWKHQKTKGFLMFSGGSKGDIEK